MLVEKLSTFYNIYDIFFMNLILISNLMLVHMFGQTTRKLVKIALLILYQTNLRTQKSNNLLIIYLTLLGLGLIKIKTVSDNSSNVKYD